MAIKDIQEKVKGLVGMREREENSKEEYDDTYWIEYTDAKFQESKNYRSTTIERQWFINHAYYKGWHNVKYSRETGKLVWGSKDPLDFQVNQVYSICRAIRGAVTKTQPQWDVDALPYATLDPDTSRILGEYLSYVYDKLEMKSLVKEVVLYGLLYGQGIFQYGYDSEADDGEGLPWVQVLDPFDVYIDPYAKGIEDARYVVKVISRPKELVEKNPYYNQEKVKEVMGSSKTSESSYKDLMDSHKADQSSLGNNLLLHETWCVTEEGIRVITTCENRVFRNDITNFSKLPFELYTPDINMGEIYGEGWVKNLVPLNKALNYLEKAVLEYNILFSKGKYKTDSNSGIKIINNRNGQILRHKPGHDIEQMDMKPMSSTPFKQIDNIKQYMQNIGAAHEAFMGRAPSGVTSGIAFETLVANAYVNIIDLIDNLADTLARVGTDILDLGYQYQLITKPFRTEAGEIFGVISGQVGEENVPKIRTGLAEGEDKEFMNIVRIPKNPEIKVKISSGVAHTKEGKREILTMLRGGGDISRRTLLEHYDLDSEEEKNRLLQEKMEVLEVEEALSPPEPVNTVPDQGMGVPPEAGVPVV